MDKTYIFEDVVNKELCSLFYDPIKREDSIGKVIKEIKRFRDDGWHSDVIWTTIIFTDNTCLYLDKNHDVMQHFSCLTRSYTDRETGEISVYVADSGRAFIEQGLIDESILNEALEILKEFRLQQLENERMEYILELEERLNKLKSV